MSRKSQRGKNRPRRDLVDAPGSQLPDTIATAYASVTYSGPIPPPGMLAEYDKLEPGRGLKILDWIEDQSHHRMDLEKMVITSDVRRSWWGLVAGFIVVMSFLGAGTALVIAGHDWAGGTIAVAAVSGTVVAFITGRTSARKERESKSRAVKRR